MTGIHSDDRQVYPDGMTYLKELSKLKLLYLDRTRATDAGVAELRRELPGLVVYYHGNLY